MECPDINLFTEYTGMWAMLQSVTGPGVIIVQTGCRNANAHIHFNASQMFIQTIIVNIPILDTTLM